MATVLKPLQKYSYKFYPELSIFLGGSIDMGSAENWQTRVENDLSKELVVLLNPRRDDWDSSWKQDPTPGTQFYDQVMWELKCQEKADILLYYFSPDSKSPITLMELGIATKLPDKVLVCCPKEFYRYGNVKMVCDYYGILFVETYDDMIKKLKEMIENDN